MKANVAKASYFHTCPGLRIAANMMTIGRCSLFHKVVKKLTGYLAEDLLFNNRLSFNELIAPEYRQSLWQEWRRVISQHLPFTYEYQIETKEGNRKWVLEMGEGVYNEEDEVVALEGIIIDIDHLKKMEEKNSTRGRL